MANVNLTRNYIYNKRWREKHPERFRRSKCKENRKYFASHPKWTKAHKKLWEAVARGYITKQPCVNCGSIEFIEGHIPDLDHPYTVVWLCDSCNKAYHKIIKAKEKAISCR